MARSSKHERPPSSSPSSSVSELSASAASEEFQPVDDHSQASTTSSGLSLRSKRRQRRGRRHGLLDSEPHVTALTAADRSVASDDLDTTPRVAKKGKGLRNARTTNLVDLKNAKRSFARGDLPELNSPKTQVEIESSAAGRNLAAFNAVRDNLKVKFARSSQNIQAGAIADFMRRDPVKSFEFVEVVDQSKNHNRNVPGWHATFRDASSKRKGVLQMRVRFPKELYSKTAAEGFGPVIADIFSRVPALTASHLKNSSVVNAMILEFLAAMSDPHATRYLSSPRWVKLREREGYTVYLSYFDPNTGKTAKRDFALEISSILDFDIPKVPKHCVFRHSDKKTKPSATEDAELGEDEHKPDQDTRYDSIPAGLSEQERARHVAAVDILCLVAYLYHRKIMSKVELNIACSAFVAQFKSGGRQMVGPYMGKPLRITSCEKSRWPPRFNILPSAAVRQDMEGSLPGIYIRSLNSRRVAPVLDVIDNTWVTQADILGAWKDGCKAADIVNAMILSGEPIPALCTCGEEHEMVTTHPCTSCLRSFLCRQLVKLEGGHPVCRACENKYASESEIGDPEEGAERNYIKQLRWGLRRTIKRELETSLGTAGITKLEPLLDEICDTAWTKISANFNDDGTFMDEYTGATYDIPRTQATNKGARDPLRPSIDAMFPYTLVDKRVIIHGADNIALTSQCLNFTKHVYVPAILQVLADWLKSKRDAEAKKRVLQKTDDIWELLLCDNGKSGQAARIKSTTNARSFAESKAAWVKARPTSRPKLIKAKAKGIWYRHTVGRVAGEGKSWRPQWASRFLKVVAQIEERFGHSFEKSTDGAPFPFPTPMPADWEWDTAFLLFAARAFRMWILCNGRWIQVDTPETLWLECLYQMADPDRKTLFNLPLTVYVRHPLRFVIAHLHHGKQLRSGWSKTQPTDISDRQEDLCNMSIESHLENVFKQDYSEDQYGAMLDRAESVNLPTEINDRESDHEEEVQASEEELEYDESEMVDDVDLEIHNDGEDV